MSSKKILIINPISLFPKVMASQDRVFNMIKRLARDHQVDVVTFVKDEAELRLSAENLKNVCHRFYPINAVNPAHSPWRRGFYHFKYLCFKYFFRHPANYFYYNQKHYLKKLFALIERNRYDIVQIEYWFMGEWLPKLKGIKTRVIDTHDILFAKKEQELRNRYGERLPASQAKLLATYRELEIRSLRLADLIVFITAADRESLSGLDLAGENVIVATGQNIDYFEKYVSRPVDDMILFYGAMSGKPNIDAFYRLRNQILPLIKKDIPGVKLTVVGSNPPAAVKNLHDGEKLIVTGYVEDVRSYLSRANILILPLNVAAGFRSRIVDAMAMGIPVIGTHQALDAVAMTHGRHGFITDDDQEMAAYAVRLLKDGPLRKAMGEACRKFVSDQYSIEATYGKLSTYYDGL